MLCEVMDMVGEEIYNFTCKLFPINRFLMGEGVRKTLSLIKEVVPEVQVYEVPSGTKVFDWIIPPELKMSAVIKLLTIEKIICMFWLTPIPSINGCHWKN